MVEFLMLSTPPPQYINHPNCIRLHDAFQDVQGDSVYLVLAYMEGAELFNMLRAQAAQGRCAPPSCCCVMLHLGTSPHYLDCGLFGYLLVMRESFLKLDFIVPDLVFGEHCFGIPVVWGLQEICCRHIIRLSSPTSFKRNPG